MNTKKLILVINPGSTSTKLALYDSNKQLKELELTHPEDELKKFDSNLEQLEYRLKAVTNALEDWETNPEDLSATIGRGGPLKPLEGGVYSVGEALMDDLQSGKLVDHASILGGLIAYKIAQKASIPAYIADPVSVDEFDEIARISGCPELPRVSLSHALNIKAVIRKICDELQINSQQKNFVVAHLGGGISIAAHKKGWLVDVNNANDAGPFSPERSGTLPLTGLLKLCFSGKYELKELKKKLIGKGGLFAYLGTSDCRKVSEMIEKGDQNAKLVFEAMAYQISKEIGAMATVMNGNVDYIILTGGIANNKQITEWVKKRVEFIAPVIESPGQNELEALATHAVSALENPSSVKKY